MLTAMAVSPKETVPKPLARRAPSELMDQPSVAGPARATGAYRRGQGVVHEEAVPPLVYVLFCLALPWIWGSIVAAVYAWRDRRGPPAKGAAPPTDYSI